ncbi:MAG TPA: anti-sigma factor domain-containing protein [Bacillota bacterium]|nr:anti-sigma factor domain-containing protein [Bacillota bacterium]
MYKGVHRLGVEKVKAIIAEIDKKHMIVITDKGDFVKVKRQMSAAIGDEIELKQRRIYPISKRLAGLAACFMACIFLSTGVYAYCTPYSYVSVDINPSLSLALNRFERVISVNPLTEDAVDLIKDAKSLKNRNIDAALSEIIKTASDKGYINEEAEDEIVVIVSAKNPKQEKKLEETVAKTAEKELSKVNNAGGVTVEKTNVENHKTAISQKVSPGRTVLEESLKKVMPEIKDEVVKDMSVKEVANLIREKRKEAEKAEKAAKEAEKAAEKAAKEAEKEAEKAAREAEKENRKRDESFDNREDREEGDKWDNRNREEDNRENRDDDKDRNNDKNRDKDKDKDDNKEKDDKKKDDKITVPSNSSDKSNNDNNKEPNKDKKRSNDTGNDDRDGSEDEREGGKKNKDDSNGDKKNNSQVRDKDKDNSSSNNDSQKKTNNSSSSNDSQEKVNNSKNSKSKIDNNGKINWNNWIYNFDWLNKNNDSDKNSRSRER